MKLHWQIFIALILGALAGVWLPSLNHYTEWIGILFMNALSMLIVPIIFFSIISGLIGVQDSGGSDFKRLGGKTIGLYVLTMVIAIITGLCLVNWIEPGKGIVLASGGGKPEHLAESSLQDIVVGFVPKNMFYAFTQNNTLPVIVIAFLVGLNLPKLRSEGKSLLSSFFQVAFDLVMVITKVVIQVSPVGIFAIVLKQFSTTGDFLPLIRTMLMYVLTVTIGLAIHTFVWFPLMLRLVYKVDPWQHFKNMLTPLLTAFSTASSGAALPITLYAVEHKDGISPKITNFTIPLGSAINMDGTALLECVAVFFIAQAYGVDLSFSQQLLVVFMSLVCAIGAAGIPMAAMVMMALILNVVGLPLEGIGLVIGVDRILDMMRTAVNVYGDTCVAVMVAKSEGEVLPIDRNRRHRKEA